MNKSEREFCKKNEQLILVKAGNIFGVNSNSFKSLGGGFANFIYEFDKSGASYVLRYSLSSYRSNNLIKGEIDFIKYLYDNGVPVAKPVPISKDNFVGQFEVDGREISVVSFEKLKGKMGVQAKWSPRLIQKWGKTMGKIHALSKNYSPAKDIKRLEWSEDKFTQQPNSYIPNYETGIIEKFEDIKNQIIALPKDIDSYGLIHGDFTPINFLVDDEKIYVYDFDDCEYNWFIMDVAKALYYSMWRDPETRAVKDNKGYADYFLSNFITGYETENILQSHWIEKIPLFIKFYEIYMYKLAHNEFDIYNLSPKVKEFFIRYKHNIEHDIPYIESAYFPWG